MSEVLRERDYNACSIGGFDSSSCRNGTCTIHSSGIPVYYVFLRQINIYIYTCIQVLLPGIIIVKNSLLRTYASLSRTSHKRVQQAILMYLIVDHSARVLQSLTLPFGHYIQHPTIPYIL